MSDTDNPLLGDLQVNELFDRPSMDFWRAHAESRPGELRHLVSQIPGGLEIEPLYTAGGASESTGWPGRAPFVRGLRPLANAVGGWEVCQPTVGSDPPEAARIMALDADHGVKGVWIRTDWTIRRGLDPDGEAVRTSVADGIVITTSDDFELLLSAIDTTDIAIHLDGGGNGVALSAALVAACRSQDLNPDAVTGSHGWDPLGALAGDGELPYGMDRSLDLVPTMARWAHTVTPRMPALTVSTLPYQTAGADPILELACATATGVEYLRRLVDAGIDIESAAGQFRWVVGIGRDLFVEATKLRVLRRLWARVIETFGGSASCPTGPIHAVTSPRCLSRRDPWVNMLRATVESTAAVIGGADCLTVLPFDSAIGTSDDFGRRMATNVHAIMREESQLHRIIDPAGGSYYVESLGEDMAQTVWSRFQQIESGGGMAKALKAGVIHRAVADAAAGQSELLATRRWPVTGVSTFPNLAEEPLIRPNPRRPAAHPDRPIDRPDESRVASSVEAAVDALRDGATLIQIAARIRGPATPTSMDSISARREAAEFERLRDASDVWLASHQKRPRAFLCNMGGRSAYRARADFARNLLEAGGIESVTDSTIETAEEAAAAFAASGAFTAVICSSDEFYVTAMPGLARALRDAGAGSVLLTGDPGAYGESWRRAGVDHFLTTNCDALAVLSHILRAEGVIHG